MSRRMLGLRWAHWFCCLLLWACCGSWAGAAPAVILNPEGESVDLAPHFSYWLDETGQADLAQALAQPATRWRDNGPYPPSFGYSQASLWLRFQVQNTSSDSQRWVLHLANSNLTEVDYHVLDLLYPETEMHLGLGEHFNDRTIPHRHMLAPLELPPTSERWVYLRIKSPNALQVPAKLQRADRFPKEDTDELFLLGMTLGFMLMLMLHGVAMGVLLREPIHFSYALFTGAATLFEMTMQGLGYQYLWPYSPGFQSHAAMVLSFFLILSAIMFSRFLLDQHAAYRGTYRQITRVMLWIVMAFPVLALILPQPLLANTYLLTAAGFGVTGTYICLRWFSRALQSAWYNVVGLVVFFCGVFLFSLNKLGVLPRVFWTEHLMFLGALVSSTVMFFVVRQQLAYAREEKIKAHEGMLAIEREARATQVRQNLLLEKKVQERTIALQSALAEVAVARREAETASAQKTRFIAAASHDIRQPLSALYFYLSALQKMPGADTQILQGMHTCVEGMHQLFNSLFDLSRLETGRWNIQTQPIALTQLFDMVQLEFQHHDQVELLFKPKACQVLADPVLLPRALRLLVSNALAHAQASRIVVLARPHGHRVRLEVRDNGIGVRPEHQKRIFDEFYQIENQEWNRSKGLGLGLSLFKRICEAQEHRFGLRSNPAEGSVFWFELPRASEELPSGAAGAGVSASPPRALEGRSVILIDDDAHVRAAVAHVLEQWGMQVMSGGTVDDILASERVLFPDVIVSDYRLPEGRTGVEAIERLRQHYMHPTLPAIIMTGEQGGRMLLDTVSFPLLLKPIKPARLRVAIEHLLDVGNSKRTVVDES